MELYEDAYEMVGVRRLIFRIAFHREFISQVYV